MRKVLEELKNESGLVLMSIKYNYNEADSISNVVLKQHVRYVLCTGQPRSMPLGDSVTLHLSPIGRW